MVLFSMTFRANRYLVFYLLPFDNNKHFFLMAVAKKNSRHLNVFIVRIYRSLARTLRMSCDFECYVFSFRVMMTN